MKTTLFVSLAYVMHAMLCGVFVPNSIYIKELVSTSDRHLLSLQIVRFAGQTVNVRATNAFAALILIGCGGGVFVPPIRLQGYHLNAGFWRDFFCECLLSLRFHKYILAFKILT